MAGLATHTGTEVGLMTEKNKVGHIVHSLPGDGFVPLPIIKNEFYIGAIICDGLMAANASSNGGDTGDVRSKCIGVAEQALDFSFGVYLVFEGYRLLWSRRSNLPAY
jgi:hypothetical protein